MPDPQLASPSIARRTRPGLLVGAIVVAVVLSACGGDDADPATTTTASGPTAPTTTAPAKGEALDAELVVKLTPDQVGTKDRPQPVKMAVDLRMEPRDEAEPAPVQTVILTIPDGVAFRPDDLKACAPDTLDAKGPSGCPGASRIGSGTVSARAGTIEVEGQATALYGGDDRVLLWVQIANPVSVGAAIEGKLEEQSEGGYRLTLEVPTDLQDVAGLPVALDRLQVSLGRGRALSTTACPERGLPFFAQLNLAGDLVVPAATTAACR